MRMQISAGQGPAECEFAVGLLVEELKKEYAGSTILSATKGREKGCFSSVVFDCGEDAEGWEGTVAWICQSPFRPHHKRKNWYVQVSILPEAEDIDESGEYRVEYFHCGGKGGQNVNKVETGVRLIHIPTGTTVTATEERTQKANRQIAMKKLQSLLKQKNAQAKQRVKKEAWHEHYEIERGNPVRVYEGMEFRRKQ